MRNMLLPGEIIVDLFAGGGGASTGIRLALGRDPDVAINHDPIALAMHAANHPHTRHLQQDVWQVPPRWATRRRPVGLLWSSPDCTHHSKAKGGPPNRDRKRRDLAWVVEKWAREVRPRVIILENVEEFVQWGPLDRTGCIIKSQKGTTFCAFVRSLRRLGYKVERRELKACDYGAPTIRKRLFLVARCDGAPIVWPAPTHGPGRIPYRTAAECIDWSLPCPSIFERKKPLADNTLRRIAAGIKRYVIDAASTFIVPITHAGGEGRVHGIDEPLRTVTTAHRGEFALVAPTLVQTGYGEREGQAPRVPGLEKPLGTVVAGGQKHALVTATIVKQNFGEKPCHGVDEPLHTITTQGNKHALVTAHIHRDFGQSVGSPADQPIGTITAGGGGKAALVTAFMAQHNGGFYDGPGRPVDVPLSTIVHRGTQQQLVTSHIVKFKGTSKDGQPVQEPLHTIQTGQHYGEVRAFLLKYYGTDQDPRLSEPLHTQTTKDRMGLVTVTIQGEPYVIVDIGMRMLQPRELFRAQGFSDEYKIDIEVAGKRITKTDQVRLCGNSVPPPDAYAIVIANMDAAAGLAAAGGAQ